MGRGAPGSVSESQSPGRWAVPVTSMENQCGHCQGSGDSSPKSPAWVEAPDHMAGVRWLSGVTLKETVLPGWGWLWEPCGWSSRPGTATLVPTLHRRCG